MASDNYNTNNSIEGAMARQSTDVKQENFICETCKFWKGGCVCEKRVFIAFVGANMSRCFYYVKGIKCPNCGRNV